VVCRGDNMAFSHIVQSVVALAHILKDIKALNFDDVDEENVSNRIEVATHLGVAITQLTELADSLEEEHEKIVDAIADVKKCAIPVIQAINGNDASKVSTLNADLAVKVRELHGHLKSMATSETETKSEKSDKKEKTVPDSATAETAPVVDVAKLESLIANDIRQTIYDLDQAYRKGDQQKKTELVQVLVEQCKQVCSYGEEVATETGLLQSLKEVQAACSQEKNQDGVQEGLKLVHRVLKKILASVSQKQTEKKPPSKKKKKKRRIRKRNERTL